MDEEKMQRMRLELGARYGYDADVISIAEGMRLPPKDYLLIHQGDNWCAFVDDFARQERALDHCFIVIFKPDCLARGLQGVMLQEWLAAGFIMEDMQFYQAATSEFWHAHYREHEQQPWFKDLLEAMANRPIMVFGMYKPGVSRLQAIADARLFAQTQRARYQQDARNNSVHVSDSETAAHREGVLWLYGTRNMLELPAEQMDEEDAGN